MIDLQDLDDDQRVAVTHGEGPLLVISAAGSGKTRVLTHRAAWLVSEGVKPSSVMLATFTRKAAKEMTERVHGLVGAAAERLRSGTLHSLFLRILKAEGYPWSKFDVLDDKGQKRTLRDLLKRERGADTDLAELMSRISLWKNELVTPEAAIEEDQWNGLAYLGYEQAKNEALALDFDDMLVRTVELFGKWPDVLERYQARTPWILVDEAQDTSTAQWRALEMLAGAVDGGHQDRGAPASGSSGGSEASASNPPNLTCVADWRQAIYSWRGARPEYVLDFEARFPGVRVVGLPTNYRSTPEIVDAANVLIRNSGKELEDMVAVRGSGVLPVCGMAESPDVEAEAVVAEITTQMELGQRPQDFAVLYRVNAYSRAYEEALARARIPYTVIGSQGFFGRREVSDMVAYLRLCADPDNEEALRRIVNRPTRYLGRAYCDAVVAYARAQELPLLDALDPPGLRARQADNADRLYSDLQVLRSAVTSKGLAAGIRFIRDGMGYDRWLLREEGSGEGDEDRRETLSELVSVATRYGEDLAGFLLYVDQQRAKSKSDDAGDKVQLMTIHRAKGLEWPVVFVVGASEGLLPHRKSTSDAALEEERRLAYVAFTRARDELHVWVVRDWLGRQLEPSRFVYEAGLVPMRAEEEVALR